MSTISTQGYSSIGYREKVSKLCKYCRECRIFLNYEPCEDSKFRWIPRNANTGSRHVCPKLFSI